AGDRPAGAHSRIDSRAGYAEKRRLMRALGALVEIIDMKILLHGSTVHEIAVRMSRLFVKSACEWYL
ncbi:MAG: ethanolamine utilization protein EutP (predicted NTPase), partial [Candidatus Azotimanducaceae bacterium]